eukprot:6464491-Amphidinium_carterae.1
MLRQVLICDVYFAEKHSKKTKNEWTPRQDACRHAACSWHWSVRLLPKAPNKTTSHIPQIASCKQFCPYLVPSMRSCFTLM